MEFINFFDISKSFRNVKDIKKSIQNSKNYKGEDSNNAEVINFFSTSKQRSYIVSTNLMVYCIVDDIRNDEPKINWSEKLSDFKNKSITISEKSQKIGVIHFGTNHKNWLYTKSLFKNISIINKIEKLTS